MNKNSKIYIAGHRGMVGSALCRHLRAAGYTNLVTRPSAELNLTRQADTEAFFTAERPDIVFLAAARVGGIMANSTQKAQFMYDNLMIATNVIEAARQTGVKKLLNLGSTCIYPKLAPQPLKEESLLTGPLEPTNDAYALAKISAIKLCKFYNDQYGTDYLSVMPTNLYGPNDNYDLQSSHVLPAFIRKFYLAKCLAENNYDAIRADGCRHGAIDSRLTDDATDAQIAAALAEHGIFADHVVLWGTGRPIREFLYADDLAEACVTLMTTRTAAEIGEFVNVGTGVGHPLIEVAAMVKTVVGYNGTLQWDASKPDGTPKKVTDVTRLHALGWRHTTGLHDGIQRACRDFLG